MAFSPRPRPHTVALSYADQDLTDTYRDERSSIASSRPHGRGDTPISRRQLSADDYSSPGRWTVSSRRSGAGSERGADEGDGRGERSNLDALLDFLDEDDAQGQSQGRDEAPLPSPHTAGRSFATSTPPPPSTSRPPASTIRPSSSRRGTLPPSTASQSPSSSRATESPSVRAHHRSLSSLSAGAGASFARSNSALAMFARANSSNVSSRPEGRGTGVPDSPSPLPGSVAALRRTGEASFGSTGGEKSAADVPDEVDEHRDTAGEEEREYEESGHGEYVEGEGEETDQEGTAGGSLDSVARVAQAALDEFDTIISQGVASSSRSASRLRNIPSPARTPSPPSATSAAAPLPPAPAQYRPRSASPPPRPANNELNAHLVQELREAQDYIAYLQEELRSISDVVEQLRERPEPCTHQPGSFATSTSTRPDAHVEETERSEREEENGTRGRRDEVVLEETAQAAFEVVKHVVSLVPSLSPSAPPPSLSSLASALSFARQIDQLAHNTPHRRRDEDVFQEENLEAVLRRVGGWERVVRSGAGEQ